MAGRRPSFPGPHTSVSVYAARQLASDALDTTAEPDLTALGADLDVWIADLVRVR